MRRMLAALAAVALSGACGSPATTADAANGQDQAPAVTEQTMRIRITTTDQVFTAVLEDSETARDFASLLPLEVTLDDYNRTEKVADLPRRLATVGAPDGTDPVVGDIAYYAPWGNLAIYYRDFDWSRGLVRLGRLEGDTSSLANVEAGKARIEIVPEDWPPTFPFSDQGKPQ